MDKKSQTKENKQLQKALDNLIASLQDIPKNANMPLSYNLKMLAVIADAVYLKHNLYVLLTNWRNKLPFIGEVGTEIDWNKVRDRLYDVMEKDTYDCNFGNAEFSDLTIDYLPSIRKREWSLWETDEKLDIDIDSDEYGKSLDSIYRDNSWFFTGKDLKKTAVKMRDEGMAKASSIDHLKKGIRVLSYESNFLLIKTLDKELDDIIDAISEIENRMYKLQTIKTNKYLLDDTMSAFFERLYTNDYWNTYIMDDGKKMKEEYESWKLSHNRAMNVSILIGKQKIEFEKLLESGFLDIFLKENSCEPHQLAEAHNKFKDYFYDKDKNIKYAAAGRYIYAHQFTEDNWRKKTLDFFRFLYIDDMTTRYINYLDKYYQNEGFRLENMKIAVKSSIKELMDLKFGRNYLFSKKQHWIAIYRVLIDERMFDLELFKYANFIALINEISPEPFRIPLKLDSIKNISKTVYQKNIEEWEDDPNYEGWDDNMLIIAKEFRKILLYYLDKYYLV